MSEKIRKVLTSSKPIRMWIDGHCVDIKQYQNKSKKHKKLQNSFLTEHNELKDCSFSNLQGLNFFKNEEGKFYTTFELPKHYYQKLQAPNDYDIKNILQKTKTNIEIPKDTEEGKLKIISDGEENLKEALDEIYSILGFIREKNMALQFAAIPLLSEEIQSKFEEFKTTLLNDDDIKNIDETLFIKKGKLHLTINVFVLLNDREIQEAVNVLNDYKNDYIIPLLEKTGPLQMEVKGIDCMNSNKKKVDVLYANVKIIGENDEINLQKITNQLSDYFYERGLLKKYQEQVKIHMTLMNSKYRKVSGKKSRHIRQTFDASKIMEKYANYEFGKCDLNDIRLAHIFAAPDKDGFYKTLAQIHLQHQISHPESPSIHVSVGKQEATEDKSFL